MFKKVSFPQWFAFYIMTGVFAYFFIYSFADINKEQREACREIAYAIVGISTTVMGFIFGSSFSSAKKDDALAAIHNRPTTVNAESIETVNTASQGAGTVPEWIPGLYAKGEKITYKGKTLEAVAEFESVNEPSTVTGEWKEVL